MTNSRGQDIIKAVLRSFSFTQAYGIDLRTIISASQKSERVQMTIVIA